MNFPRPLITPDALAPLLARETIVLADCRFILENPDAGPAAYAEGHLPGAVYFHLDHDLSAPVGEHGGRHPLPDPAELAAKLGAAGIGAGARVVAYDDGGQYAARFWWLLRWLGHDDVAVLDGGFKAWTDAGMPVTTALSSPTSRTFLPHPRPEMVASMEEVRSRPADLVVIDARSPERFAGEPTPLDPKQGHVPGAVNQFWQESLRSDATWLSAGEQIARFKGLDPRRVIHHCGSGVTACANLLAMEIAGLPGSRLYPGSWGDWCSWPENPVQKD